MIRSPWEKVAIQLLVMVSVLFSAGFAVGVACWTVYYLDSHIH